MDLSLTSRARRLRDQLEKKLLLLAPGRPALSEGVAASHWSEPSASFRLPPPSLAAHLVRVHRVAGREGVDLRVRALLCARIAAGVPVLVPGAWPALEREQVRMLDEAERPGEPFHGLDSEQTLQDLALVTGRLVPGGAQLCEPHRTLGRGQILRHGFQQATTFMRFVVSLGGYDRFIELHGSPRVLPQFTPDGWEDTFERCAELLHADPSARGVFASGWFFDPVIETLSPRLAYLRQRPGRAGAQFFRVGPDAESTRQALATSPTRRERHAAGSYMPERWLMIWPRAELLEWARDRAMVLGPTMSSLAPRSSPSQIAASS